MLFVASVDFPLTDMGRIEMPDSPFDELVDAAFDHLVFKMPAMGLTTIGLLRCGGH